jgi:Family of unknown function (DUF6262)
MSGRQAPAALAAAAQQRTEEAKKRTRQAMKRLRAADVPVTFRAVAIEAGVSRDFLYRNKEMRALVNNSRSAASSKTMPARADDSNVLRLVRERCAAELAASRADIAELSRRLEAAHTEIHRLKRELRRRQPRS